MVSNAKPLKVMGFIDYFSGAFFYQAQTAKFTSEAYQTFLCHILADTTKPLFIIQDGARYHTSAAMRAFFAAHGDRLSELCDILGYGQSLVARLWFGHQGIYHN
ncbi:MAG TPA: hypothetical protein PLD43_03620 [Anaerolineae bacterium]|nr:hypothetical protein [Anaerolineae bacterium]